MLQLVNVGHKSLADYATLAARGLSDEIRRLAAPLQGKRVLELSATAKTIHNALQGDPRGLSDEQRACYARYQELNARELDADAYDFVVVPCVIWPPAIDPLAPKNMGLSVEDAAYIVEQFGIDVGRPLLTQVSRFDPWKDPVGVVDAYRMLKERRPDVQLALVGSMAQDDPEGWDFYNQTVAYADGDPDVFILSNSNNVGSVEVNAFQVHSAAVIQKSIREGFGLTVAEALWKTRPVVGGNAAGIAAQIQNGVTGWLVDSPAACAAACLEILADPAAPRVRALAGKEHVRSRYLTPRLLRDWLALFNRLLGHEIEGAELEVVAAAS
jgi:glycosyltransferase involved in cell wall biosynthesis